MLTETDAKEKWCPFARSLGTLIQPAQPGGSDHVVATGGQNRGYQMGGPLHNCMCIASGCMAWQWGRQEYEQGEPLPIGTGPADPGWEKDSEVWCAGGKYGAGEKRQRWRKLLPRTGWCSALSSRK